VTERHFALTSLEEPRTLRKYERKRLLTLARMPERQNTSLASQSQRHWLVVVGFSDERSSI
jgi:hypothetical protein